MASAQLRPSLPSGERRPLNPPLSSPPRPPSPAPVTSPALPRRDHGDHRAPARPCAMASIAPSAPLAPNPCEIQEPMEDLPAEVESNPSRIPYKQDPSLAGELADGTVINPAVEYHEPDAEVDSSGDSSERKPPSTEDDTVADGRELQQRVLRLTYRKQHSYVTKSNQTRVVKTPGGKLVYEYTKKHASGQKCPVTEKKIQGVFFILSATSENIRYFLRGQVCYRNQQTKSFLQLLELPYLLDSSKSEVFCRNESSSQPGNTLDVKM